MTGPPSAPIAPATILPFPTIATVARPPDRAPSKRSRYARQATLLRFFDERVWPWLEAIGRRALTRAEYQTSLRFWQRRRATRRWLRSASGTATRSSDSAGREGRASRRSANTG